MRYYTFCVVSGAKTQGQTCTTDADCAPTFGCFAPTCAQYCDPANPSACGGAGCSAR